MIIDRKNEITDFLRLACENVSQAIDQCINKGEPEPDITKLDINASTIWTKIEDFYLFITLKLENILDILLTNNFIIKKDNDNINITYDGIFHVSNIFNINPNHYHILTQNDLGNLSRDYIKALNRLSKNKGDCYDIFKIRDELDISFLSIPQ